MSGGLAPEDPDREHLERLAAELERRGTTGPSAAVAPPPPAPVAGRARRAGRWGILAGVALLLFKLKGPLLLVLGKLKFLAAGAKLLGLGKVATTGGTMLLTIWVYAQTWGLWFAVGFVLLIFVHEMGHAAAMWARGLKAGAPVFIPFVGAMIAMKDFPPNARVEAEVAIAGPVAGGLAAAVCWGLGEALGSPLLVALAFSGFFLNLFNLIPVSPLDGGRIAGAISRWFWVGGLAVAVWMAVRTANPLLWAIVVLGAFRAVSSFRGVGEQRPGYFEISAAERTAIAVGYFALAALLAGGVALLSDAAA